MNHKNDNPFRKFIPYAFWFVIFYWGVKYALPLLAPFLLGLSAAAAVRKPAETLAARIPGLSARVCRIILTAALLFAVAAVLYLLLCSLIEGAVAFCPGIPGRIDSLRQWIADASAGREDAGAWEKFTAFIASGASRCIDLFTENYRDYLPSVLGRSTRLVSGIPSLLTAAAFAALSALFASADPDAVRASVRNLLPEEAAATVSRVIRTSVSTCAALMQTYGTLLLVTFAELCAGLGIMALTGHGTGRILPTALVIALIDILPVLGTGTVLVPWSLFEFLSGRTVSGIMLLVMFAVIEVVRNTLEPKLLAGRLALHPFFTLLGVYVGAKLFGAVGIFVMPPAMMIFRQLRVKPSDSETLSEAISSEK